MVKHKHKGKRYGTRAKYKKTKREKGKPTVSKMLKKFNLGDSVHINVDSSLHKGMPFRRFIGKTGLVVGKQGSCYFIKITDMHADKVILVHPVHLKLQTAIAKTKQKTGEKRYSARAKYSKIRQEKATSASKSKK